MTRAPHDGPRSQFAAIIAPLDDDLSEPAIDALSTAETIGIPDPSLSIPLGSTGVSMVQYEQPTFTSGFQIPQVIDHARTHHPRAIAAVRMIDQARAELRAADRNESPEFVVDLNTPVHDEDDPTELSTRLTFPIQQRAITQTLVRAARADLARAHALHQTTLRQLGQDALSAAIRLAYLQEKLALDDQTLQLAEERAALLSPERQPGDTAQILMDHVGAIAAARQASRDTFATHEQLALARAELAQAMGMDAADPSGATQTLSIDMELDSAWQPLPPMADVVAAVVRDSAELVAADWATQKGWIEHQLSREAPLAMQVGPRYQDRLGRDDDSVGIRFQSDLPMLSDSRDAVVIAELNAQALQDQQEISRHQIASAVAKDYLELEAVSQQFQSLVSAPSVAELQSALDELQTQSLLTGEQQIRIRQAILGHQQELLEMRYRMTMLRSKLRLHAM